MIHPKSLVFLYAPQTQDEFLRGFQDLLNYLLDPYNGAKHLRAAIPDHGELFNSFLEETFRAIAQERHLITSSPGKIEDVIPAIAEMLVPKVEILRENQKKDLHDRIQFYPPASLVDFLSTLIRFDSFDPRIEMASMQIVSFLEAANPRYTLSSESYRRMSLEKNIRYFIRCIENGKVLEQATCLKMIVGIWLGNKYPVDSKQTAAVWIKETIWDYKEKINRSPSYLEALLVAKTFNSHDIPWVWEAITTQYKQSPSEFHSLWHQGNDTTRALMVLYYARNSKLHKRPDFSIVSLWHYIDEDVVHILKNWYSEDYQLVVNFFEEEQKAVYNEPAPLPGPDGFKKRAAIEEAHASITHALRVLK